MDPCKSDPGGLDPGKDLPLMANTCDIMVKHFILDLIVDLDKKSFDGIILLFTEPSKKRKDELDDVAMATADNIGEKMQRNTCDNVGTSESISQKPFYFVLDACDLTITATEEIVLHHQTKQCCDGHSATKDSAVSSEQTFDQNRSHLLEDILRYDGYNYKARNERLWECKDLPGKPLNFSVEPWCVRLWKNGIYNVRDFPPVVRIFYQTHSKGTSVTWAHDQDDNLCVFTQGAWINNRALFPCQEPPVAMSTWQANISTPTEYIVLMSGDEEAVTKILDDGYTSYRYHVNVVSPSSTLTIAIGKWTGVSVVTEQQSSSVSGDLNSQSQAPQDCEHSDKWPCRVNRYDQPIIPCRIFAPKSLIQKTVNEFGPWLPKYLQASFDLLGPHPFCRLDLLLVPRCFASMGLASPSIIFLSESLLSGDQSMSIRLAHEISHSWFGLIIGARDWTEEWLSEGFATYMEESIHAKAKKWSPKQQKAYCDLRSILRYRSLVAELENTEEELQTLRPSGEATVGSESQDGQIHYVKNGLNEDKWFIQVHYIKGYFLLRYLANLVGQSHFDGLIKKYVLRYHCQQVLSQQLFSLFFEAFPHLCDQGITKETIYSDWLDNPGMPKDLNPDEFTHSNWLVDEVNIECKTWVEIERKNRCKKSPRKKMKSFEDQHEKLCADQIQLLLEMILEWEAMSVQTLQQLDSVYGVSHGNAEIRHRWCELLVKHRYRARYSDVKQFLLQDQAMGVYLYGELILSEKPTERRLAEACFKTVSREMDRGCYNTVFEMLYGAKHRS